MGTCGLVDDVGLASLTGAGRFAAQLAMTEITTNDNAR
jgi:hypothetical protein